MNELKVLGTENVAGYQFTGIEGGFGKDKKAMLVPDIAKIHGQRTAKINELLNRNKKQFIDGVDIIDFLSPSEGLRNFAKENGLITNNRVKHIYLLSERGYLKLLKIMDDDKAWDIYNEIVDNYFNMRAEIKHVATKYEKLMQLANLTSNEEMKEYLISKVIEEITGEIVDVPLGFSLFQMERELHISWTIIDYTANKLGLKAPISQRNKFGYWEPQDCGAYISYNWYATALSTHKEGIKSMKIVDERENLLDVENWHIGDVIEFGDRFDGLTLGMIVQDDYKSYWLLDLEKGDTQSTNTFRFNDLGALIQAINNCYDIARKVNVELHIKEGE